MRYPVLHRGVWLNHKEALETPAGLAAEHEGPGVRRREEPDAVSPAAGQPGDEDSARRQELEEA